MPSPTYPPHKHNGSLGEKKREKKRERKHFLNEGEKERKEGGDKEIRKNVYGGRRKKKKKTRESELEKMKGD